MYDKKSFNGSGKDGGRKLMTKKSVLAVLFSVIGSVFTAIAILIIMGIIAVVLIINHLKPEEPPVKHAQFQYRIEYEVYGEIYEKSDVF